MYKVHDHQYEFEKFNEHKVSPQYYQIKQYSRVLNTQYHCEETSNHHTIF